MSYRLTIEYGNYASDFTNTFETIEEAQEVLNTHHSLFTHPIWKARIVEVDENGDEVAGDLIYHYQNGANSPRNLGEEQRPMTAEALMSAMEEETVQFAQFAKGMARRVGRHVKIATENEVPMEFIAAALNKAAKAIEDSAESMDAEFSKVFDET